MKPALIALLIPALALSACGEPEPSAEDRLEALEQQTQDIADRAERIGERLEQAGERATTDDLAMADELLLETESFVISNSSGSPIGVVTIIDVDDGVEVDLDVTAMPEGSHAIHFHENGTCDGPDFTSAGGHYNPSGANHGFEASAPNPHAGDMRNFEAPVSGVVKTTLTNERVTLGPRRDLAPLKDDNGTALIIHAAADDYSSQPSGAAGARIACAVID